MSALRLKRPRSCQDCYAQNIASGGSRMCRLGHKQKVTQIGILVPAEPCEVPRSYVDWCAIMRDRERRGIYG